MTTKTLEEVKELAKGYDLVPIQEEIFADLVTPIQLLRKIAAGKKNYYLLRYLLISGNNRLSQPFLSPVFVLSLLYFPCRKPA